MKFRKSNAWIVETEHTIPVMREVDVLVAGGGPAGMCAALAAARTGARTMLVERYGCLGGIWTAGLVNPLFEYANKGAILADLVTALKTAGGWGGLWNMCFDGEQMKLLLDRMALEAGIDVLMHTLIVESLVEDGVVRGVVVENKNGRGAILARVTIDCTGDGDVAARAGASFGKGRSNDGLTQSMTLMFRVGGVKFQQKDASDLYSVIRQFAPEEAAGLTHNKPWIINLPRPGEAVVQMTHMLRMDGTRAEDLTAASMEGRRQVARAMEIFRKCASRLGDVYLIETAMQIGVRETRRIIGDYVITEDDLVTGRTFEDGMVTASFGIDIHSPDSADQIVRPVKPYWIPYRSQLPNGLEQILTAGRCISGTHEAHAAYRVTGTCAAMGHVAGTAAAMSVCAGVSPRKLPIDALKAVLAEQGLVCLP
ncbi:MAG: FAD-dependent oxidoreductase [Verrucomicrobia bacterium]|nr:FAD-dependent oxidoreductase [Verrucomicrobiota bacterium]